MKEKNAWMCVKGGEREKKRMRARTRVCPTLRVSLEL